MLSLKRLQVQIDGDIYPRGGELSITTSTTFEAYFVADVFVRGSGQGHGGNVIGSPVGTIMGEHGRNGDSGTSGVVSWAGEISAGIADGGANAGDKLYVGQTIQADAGADGGITTFSASGVTISAGNSNTWGRGAWWNRTVTEASDYAYGSIPPINPLLGSLGQGGYQRVIGTNITSEPSRSGVVQIPEILD